MAVLKKKADPDSAVYELGMDTSLLSHKEEQPNSMYINKDWLQDW